ncbi:hypothetical protein E2562_017466 [Oryza meyeriana var. granulata]|uniref:Uncharacterized protein n=1 Tax=Oryza meyeriana var. granulata TaxID=110450 RepID=A0A6G1DXQ8_9ORYZ|nr:hypothetical protein E2562_017466 [Oryza meyeriana var. granulata]
MLKGKLATSNNGSATELFALADKAARRAEACEDLAEKHCVEKAPRVNPPPSPSKGDLRWKRQWPSFDEVLTSSQDDHR